MIVLNVGTVIALLICCFIVGYAFGKSRNG